MWKRKVVVDGVTSPKILMSVFSYVTESECKEKALQKKALHGANVAFHVIVGTVPGNDDLPYRLLAC